MKPLYFSATVAAALITLGVAGAAFGQAPSIEGTYKLMSRTLANGTTMSPPQIMGLFTYTKTHRNFNIVQRNDAGKFRSFSVMSTYTLTTTEYSETLLSSVLDDQIAGKGIVYDVSGRTQSVPVKIEGGRIEFTPPFDVPSLVFEGNRMTATRDGRIDVWEKVP